jgi:hypothetical protein
MSTSANFRLPQYNANTCNDDNWMEAGRTLEIIGDAEVSNQYTHGEW